MEGTRQGLGPGREARSTMGQSPEEGPRVVPST